MAPRPRLSLKARALGWLAQREHSRSELRRKLLRVARQEAAEREAAGAGEAVSAPGADARPANGRAHPRLDPASDPPAEGPSPSAGACADPQRCVDNLLDWLQAHGYLSEARFVESRVHARAARYGNLRIRQELARHGVTPDDATLQQLRDTELERARDVWRRKFGHPPADRVERVRHMRFLAQRGFSAEIVRRVVQGADDD